MRYKLLAVLLLIPFLGFGQSFFVSQVGIQYIDYLHSYRQILQIEPEFSLPFNTSRVTVPSLSVGYEYIFKNQLFFLSEYRIASFDLIDQGLYYRDYYDYSLDLELGRGFKLGSKFEIDPLIGVGLKYSIFSVHYKYYEFGKNLLIAGLYVAPTLGMGLNYKFRNFDLGIKFNFESVLSPEFRFAKYGYIYNLGMVFRFKL